MSSVKGFWILFTIIEAVMSKVALHKNEMEELSS